MDVFNNIMLDLETWGKKNYSVIVSIGAIAFDINSGNISDNYFYNVIDAQTCLDVGLNVDASTLYWWFKQSKNSQNKILENKDSIVDVLIKFNGWFNSFKDEYGDVFIWGNGATFDISLLNNAFEKIKVKPPWNFRNIRDVRTIVSLNKHIKEDIVNKTKILNHYPIDDCKLQIKYLTEIYKTLKL